MTIDHVMLQIGQLLTSDTSLRVSVRGSEAYAAKGEIVLPSIEHFAVLGIDGAERVLHGLVDHEVGHALDTDFEAFGELELHSFLRLVANGIEDAVIERRRGALYPGSKHNLAVKNRHFWEASTAKRAERPLLWRVAMLFGLLSRVDGVPTLSEAQAVDAEAMALVRVAIQAAGDLDALAARPGSPTRESIARARAVLEALGVDESTQIEKPAAAPVTPEEAVRAAFLEKLEDDDGSPYVVFDPSFDLETDLQDAGSPDAYERERLRALPIVDHLAEVFESALFSHTEVRTRPVADADDERADVDVTCLSAFALGALSSDEIWEARTGGDLTTGRPAVAVLLDCSGSMSGAKIDTARLCAIACHESLSRVHVPHEITGYTTLLDDLPVPAAWISSRVQHAHFVELRKTLVAAAARGERLSTYARTCAVDDPSRAVLQVPIHAVFKDFAATNAWGLSNVAAIGNNLDGESVLWQARRLAQRPESRRILIVLSDGLPNGSNRREQGARYLADAVRRVVESGIEVIGIGIGTEHVKDYYPQWRVCRQPSDLPSAMASVLAEAAT